MSCTCSEKNEVVVNGELVDDQTICAKTPNYEMYGECMHLHASRTDALFCLSIKTHAH
jgi:hypothetical protein